MTLGQYSTANTANAAGSFGPRRPITFANTVLSTANQTRETSTANRKRTPVTATA